MRPRTVKKIWTITWKIALFLIVWGVLIVPAPFVFGLQTDAAGGFLRPETRLYLELYGVLAILLAAWAMVRFIDRRSFTSLGFVAAKAIRDLVTGLLLGAGLIALAVVILWLAGWARTVPSVAFSWSTLALTGTAMLLNTVTQEVMVRGYVLQTVASQFRILVAVIVSSVIFAALHAGAIAEGGVLPALNLFAAGVLLAVAYTASRNLWLPIGLHFAWNVVQGPVLGITVSGQALDSGWRMVELDGPVAFTGGAFGLEGGVVATFVTMLGIVILVRKNPWLPGRRSRGSRGSGTIPEDAERGAGWSIGASRTRTRD